MSNGENNQDAALTENHPDAATPTLSGFDPARYRDHVDAFDISEQQKQELLATLWSIMSSFVELGFKADVLSILLPENTIPDDTEMI